MRSPFSDSENDPNIRYIITERDVMDILIAFNNGDYDWILYFIENLNPIVSGEDLEAYSFEQIIANAGIISYQGRRD